MNMKKLFLLNLPYLLFVYPFDKLAQAFRLAPGADLSGKLLSIGDGFTAALSSPWLSFQPTDLLIGIAGAVVLRMAVYLKGKNAKKYRIKCLNLINFRKSMKYNPLSYIRSEKDILKLVNALIMNTKGEGEKSSEDFWVKAERLYYSALIGYIWYEATEEEKNFITLLDLINASEAREDDETYQSPVDLLFSQLELSLIHI